MVARNKGDKDYTKSEKQLLVSLINYYSLFRATDNEIIQKLSKRIGKNVLETLFYRLKEEAKAKRKDSEECLDNYAKYQFVDFYRQRIDELEYVQRNLIKILASETEKEDEEIRNIRLQTRNCKSAFFLARNNMEDDNKYIDSLNLKQYFKLVK